MGNILQQSPLNFKVSLFSLWEYREPTVAFYFGTEIVIFALPNYGGMIAVFRDAFKGRGSFVWSKDRGNGAILQIGMPTYGLLPEE